MRHTLVGLVLFVLLSPAAVLAQIRGEVESIGFGGYYRPDAWTPMVVRIRTAGLTTGFHKLQVIQEDLDRDRPAYTRDISIDTSQAEQRFWMFFIPQPSGLPDARASGSLDELRQRLRVQLLTADNKPAGQLAQTQVPESLDGPPARDGALLRGRKLVLCIYDGDSRPAFREYDRAIGISEDVAFVAMRPRDLPENALAYTAVDSILWLNADANALDEGGARRTAAIEQYVRTGGRLIVCQSPERDRLTPLAHLLPIEYVAAGGTSLVEMKETQQPEPLRSLARSNDPRDAWSTVVGPFRMGAATPKPNAMVEERLAIEWPDGTTSPWIVRGVLGLGGTTWVAQDLGDPSLTARTATAGWAHVWDTVFAWNNDTLPAARRGDDDNGYSDPSSAIDVGYTLLTGMNHAGRGAALVLMAVIFFIIYWLAAGPGSYFALINWRKKELSWLAFAAAAVVATAITLIMVRLVLRGPPVVKHVTVVQSAVGQPAIATSNIGLYIPNDGSIPVTLGQTAEGSLPYVAGYPQHPQQRPTDTDRPPVQGEYIVPVPDDTEAGAPVVAFPYRSTLKKVQARWSGDLAGRVDGFAKLSLNQLRGVDGVLTNNTGADLRDIYIAYRNANGQMRVLYREKWVKGTTIDFARDVADPPFQVTPPGLNLETEAERRRYRVPREDRLGGWPIIDFMGTGRGDAGWTSWWYGGLRNQGLSGMGNIATLDDSTNGYVRSLPLMALYDLLPTPRDQTRNERSRFEILRRGVRHLNMSHIVSNGQMLVLASTAEQQPLPYPFLVDGDPYGGTGDLLYEFVIPLDRTPPEPPATQPTTAPSE
ncbi:MAG TPA: hypothetical protein VGN72_23875 [Tepidisphaeraceae bacterium]|jgi:hypothetical protein|nr:hypothetical protein [Tepidisphaeraceae bacterium]